MSVRGLDIIAVDACDHPERPHKYGVDVRQGAFTLWNQQLAAKTVLTADLVDISVGREHAPVFGSGVLVSGAGDAGGRLQVSRLETCAVFSDGKIPGGTADQITGGVFVAYGALAHRAHPSESAAHAGELATASHYSSGQLAAKMLASLASVLCV